MEIPSSIRTVTVYTDRALVVRQGTATLKVGVQEVLVVGLPVALDVESLRASGHGAVGVKILGVEARERTQPKPSNQSAREVQDEFERLQDVGRSINERENLLTRRLETLHQLTETAATRYAVALSKGEASLESVTQLLDYVAAQTNQINEQRAQIEIEKRENAAQQMSLQNRLKQLQNAKNKTERVVSVLLEASQAGEWHLELSYVVSGASWRPIYDARLTLQPSEQDLTGHLSLTYGALLTQNSGENWEDVELTLSTARPGLGTLPPKLQPVWLDVEQIPTVSYEMARYPSPMATVAPPMPAGAANVKRRAAERETDTVVDLDEPIPSVQASQSEASVESDGATVTFGLPYRLSVPSDGQPHRTTVATFEPPCRLDYTAIPLRASLAFLKAKVTNKSALSLLDGSVNIFREGVFVGKSRLQATPPTGEFELFLGPDEAVKAERELTAREVDKNLLGNVRRTHFAYALTLRNAKPHPVRLVLQDQIPVSRSETIKVKLRAAESTPQVSDLGVLNWELVLRAGEKRVVRFDYGIETPRDVRVLEFRD